MDTIPPCRWRTDLAEAGLVCHSPRYVAPPNYVNANFCCACHYVEAPIMPLSGGGSTEKIAVAMLYTPEIASMGQISAGSLRSYAKRHGYRAVISETIIDPTRPPSWSKLLLICGYLEANPACEWLFWIDADAVITRPEQALEELIDAKADMIVGEDISGPMNLGVFLIRNCPASLALFRRAYAKTAYIHHPCWEQPAVAEAIAENCTGLVVKIVSRRLFNSFAFEHQSGDFIIHFAGCSAVDKQRGVERFTIHEVG